jgi:hypothetical protein
VTVRRSQGVHEAVLSTVNYRISTDTQLIEFVCHNNVSAQHYVGASGKPDAPK